MTAIRPNRITLSRDLTPEQEQALAHELVQVQSEEELDRFIPLLLPALKLAAPLLSKVAGPLLKSVAGGLLGGGGGGRRRRPAPTQEEQFLGNIIGKLFGEIQSDSEQENFLLGGLLKGLFKRESESELQGEEENFLLGGLLKGLFNREYEGETYVQEQFIGNILKGILGGEINEGELPPHVRRMRRARRFVRLASRASRRAAAEIVRLIESGQRPTEDDVRRLIIGAFISVARRRFRGPAMMDAPPAGGPVEYQPGPAQPPQGGTVLEMLTTGARPLAM